MSQPSDKSSPPSFPEVTPQERSKPAPAKGRFRFSKVFGRWWWIATLLVVVLTYAVAMIPTWMSMRGPLYESTALIEVKPIAAVDPTAMTSTVTPLGPLVSRQFMSTQFEVVTALMTLEIALGKYDLLNRLGGDRIEAFARMKKSICTTQRHGTDLIEISYRDEDSELARDGATAVYEAYRERREELERGVRKGHLKAIKTELQNENDRVAERRKRLMDIAEKVGVVWVEGEKGGGVVEGSSGVMDAARKQLYEAELEREKISFQIAKLLSVKGEDRMLLLVRLAGASMQKTYKKYEGTVKEIETLKSSGLAGAHPDIKFRKTRLIELKKDLDKRAVNVQEGLNYRLKVVEQRMKKLKGTVSKLQNESIEKARSIQEFKVARKEYQMVLTIKDQMQVKYDMEKTKMVMPTNSIIIHQIPEQSGVPVTRGREFITSLGTVLSLPFSIGLGIMCMYIAEAIFPRREVGGGL